MGGLPGLLGTGYGQVALVKLGLFVVLLALAALNRLALTDRLAGARRSPHGATCGYLSPPRRCWAHLWCSQQAFLHRTPLAHMNSRFGPSHGG